jgi:hypothetical protein
MIAPSGLEQIDGKKASSIEENLLCDIDRHCGRNSIFRLLDGLFFASGAELEGR